MINKFIYCLILILLCGCDKREGITVESAFMRPILPEPTYKFSRHSASSVDLQSLDYISESIDIIYESILQRADYRREFNDNQYYSYFTNGYNVGYAPSDYIAVSTRFSNERANILAHFSSLIEDVKLLSGFGKGEAAASFRNRPAKRNSSGYVGSNIGVKNLVYVNAKGLVVADIYRLELLATIFLDQLFNVHSSLDTLTDRKLLKAHEALDLLSGKNYTRLEHHWDLAYGCFKKWSPLLQGNGQPLLRDKMQKINSAFVQGRYDIFNYDYTALREKAKLIHFELTRAIAIKSMYLLLGVNTLANLQEDTAYGFLFLSEAIAYIYSLQFTHFEGDKAYFSSQKINAMIDELLQGEGLWDTERLLNDDPKAKGSLFNIALYLGKPFNVSPNQIINGK